MMFLQDPVRSVEWKEVLRQFDATYQSGAAVAAASSSTGASPAAASTFDWSSVFGGQTQFDEEKIKAKYALAGVANVTCYIVTPSDYEEPGPDDEDAPPPQYQFWMSASVDLTVPDTLPVLTYGPGTWVTDARAKTALSETPDKVVLCAFQSCEDMVVLEERLSDRVRLASMLQCCIDGSELFLCS